eukprot:368196_1
MAAKHGAGKENYIKNLDANWIAYQTITAQALYVCFIPFLVYGIIKWIALKRHIVIMKRFPMVSIVMILLGFFNSTWWICQAWMRYSSQLNYTPYSYNVLHVRSSVSLSFATNGLINLRLFLTYLRWKHNRIVSQRTSSSVASKSETIDKTIDILSSDQKTIHKTQRKVTHKLYTHWFSITIILLTLFGFFCITFIMKAFIVWSTWTFVMIITIILIIMIIINKVKDGIGSTKEGLAMVIIFIFGTVNASLNRIGGVVPYISHIVLSLIVYIQALYPLYIALYYIYKIDGTLTTKDERESETETETEMKTVDNNESDLSLFEFLDRNIENYTAFHEYLNYMWALENLLFLERISIFYQIVLKYKNNNKTGTQIKKHRRIEFKYLQGIYQDYQKQIDNVCKDKNDIEFKDLKLSFFRIGQQIFTEFIDADAVNQINISSAHRQELIFLFQNEESMNKFQSLNDFLKVFDNARFEIQRLLMGVYNYHFSNRV